MRKPPTCYKSLTKYIIYCCKEYISPSAGIELTTLVVIGTDGKGSCLSNKHTTIMALQTDGIALRNMQYVAAFTLYFKEGKGTIYRQYCDVFKKLWHWV